MKLFTRDSTVGIFRGFSEGGLEFHADLVLPYRNDFQSTPMHGQFLIVQLEHEEEAVIGRITSISAQGRLASGAGEDYGIRAVAEERPIPEDLREQYLKYRIDMRVLGVLRIHNGKVVYAASHRRLPHVGSKVAFLDSDLLREITGHNQSGGAELGYFALGEFIYAGDDKRLSHAPWMQVKSPAVIPRFQVSDIVARRSMVFARAGFGKSNLVKLLFSNLYKEVPTVEKRGGRRVPVGTIIFDPDGEYFWPDDKGRPGLCDVPHLQDKVIVFTPKEGPSPFYSSFIAGKIKLDVRRLRPQDVLSIALPPERQDQQNVRKLKSMNDGDWRALVDEIHTNGNGADPELIKKLLRLEEGQDAEMTAARANMTTVVRMLHDPSSQLMDMLIAGLRTGNICIVDVSQMRGMAALVLSGLILKRIFDHNQDEFTKATPQTIPVIAVVEEAQSVLGSEGSGGEGPYISWVKEGRKFDLGAMLITQQPGSISGEILSQGDNWFVFHLLSSGDLLAIKKANAHFSDDLLSSLLNEPIPGHGIFWSSVSGKSYPIPIRVLSFEGQYHAMDGEYKLPAVATRGAALRAEFEAALQESRSAQPVEAGLHSGSPVDIQDETRVDSRLTDPDQPEDVLSTHVSAAFHRVRSNAKLMQKIKTTGWTWKGVVDEIERALPKTITDDKNRMAADLVKEFLNETFGPKIWTTEQRPSKSNPGKQTLWVVLRR